MDPYRKGADPPPLDEQSRARDELAKDADALRHRRERVERDREEVLAKNEARVRREATRFSARRFADATVWWFDSTLAAFLGVLGVGMGVTICFASKDASAGRGIIAVSVVVAGLFFAWWALAAALFRRWLAALPFAVEGIVEALGRGEAAKEVRVAVHFRGASPGADSLREIVGAEGGGTVRKLGDAALAIDSPELERTSTNKPLRAWFKRLVRRTLAKVHRGYPIERVEVTVTKSDEFFLGVGD
ncbi:MAG: hypothetical protein ACLQVI_08575 [Polyangiaceae bacterium]